MTDAALGEPQSAHALPHFVAVILVLELSCVRVCSHIGALKMYADMCVHSPVCCHVCAYVCSHMRLIFVISHVCSHICCQCSLICALSYLCSHMCAYTYVLSFVFFYFIFLYVYTLVCAPECGSSPIHLSGPSLNTVQGLLLGHPSTRFLVCGVRFVPAPRIFVVCTGRCSAKEDLPGS